MHYRKFIYCLAGFLCCAPAAFAQPANDDCANASVITIGNGGYAYGTFTSATFDITSATVQSGESFASAIFIAGLDKKSMWFKFTLPTHRYVKVTLKQPGTLIAAGDAGFAVYKTGNCLPADVATKFTPIPRFGSSENSCTDPGEYLVQVSVNNNANGPLYIQLDISDQKALYDHPKDAYDFGTLASNTSHVDYGIECQSLEDGTEICPSLANSAVYTKSTWHTFTTPAYFDYLSVLLASPNCNFGSKKVFGYKLYKGNAATTPIPSLTTITACDSFVTDGQYADYKLYRCNELQPNTTYSIQLFFDSTFIDQVRLAVAFEGIAPTQAPVPIFSGVPSTNALGTLANGYTSATDYFGCNSRHSLYSCSPSLLPTGVLYNGTSYTLSTFFTFTLSSSANVDLSAYVGACNYPVLLRLYSQALTNDCKALDTSNVISLSQSNLRATCLAAGTYTLHVSGSDSLQTNNYATYCSSLAGNGHICMLADLGQQVNLSFNITYVRGYNLFSLHNANEYDPINGTGSVLQPLVNSQLYSVAPDTFGCQPTVLPEATVCNNATKVMYREFAVKDSGLVTFTNKRYPLTYKLYKGDANALATAQNVHTYPSFMTGLIPYSECLDYYEYCAPDRVCIMPGTYTFATFGSDNDIGTTDQPNLQFNLLTSKHNTPAAAQDLGSILDTIALNNTSYVNSDVDYFSCYDNAVTINGHPPCTISGHAATKVIYRQFYLSKASVISISSGNSCGSNVMSLFAGKVTNGIATLTAVGGSWDCFSYGQSSDKCVTIPAGWYTVVSYGSGPSYTQPLNNLNEKGYSSDAGMPDQFTITVTEACEGPRYNRPFKAAIDTVTKKPFAISWLVHSTTPSFPLYTEHFNCTTDTPFTTHPVVACNATDNRVAYYVFTLDKTTSIHIDLQTYSGPGYTGALYALDVRKDSLLFATAAPVASCFSSYSGVKLCNLPAGTYTLVVFSGDANSCYNVTPLISKPCNEPLYNRPYKAAVDSVTKKPFLITWHQRAGGTAAYPLTDTTYQLYTEYFDCTTDTPFALRPIKPCDENVNRVAYYVFTTTQESYTEINTQGLWGEVFALDARKDSTQFTTAVPVQPCLQSNGHIEICRLQPGTYTLVLFAGDNNQCSSVSPTIYIDQVGYSRFDHAVKAYDFGAVAPDSAYHYGKTGDVNPLNASRAPSNDFFYCTSGSQQKDPTESACGTFYNANIYSGTTNNYLFDEGTTNYGAIPRRNLWYTFVINRPGYVHVKVENKTSDKTYQYPFAVYKSDVDGSLPFSTVVSSGLVDSTQAQGLTFTGSNYDNGRYYCIPYQNETIFYLDPCTFTVPQRYYVLVDNTNSSPYEPAGMLPNSQAEVSILLDTVNAIPTKFDHYYQAGNIGSVGQGTYTGEQDNYSCASADANDPVQNYQYCAKKTLWYKFTATITGTVLYRAWINKTADYQDQKIQLFRQVVAGDSTINGMDYLSSTGYYDNATQSYWAQTCVSPGIYYLVFTGCGQQNEFVYPEIKLLEQAGDFCSAPVIAAINGAGADTASVLIDCHTIGTDYGEFGPELTCPNGAKTGDYKSSWFRMDISGKDTLDVTVFLEQHTNAKSDQIQYRMMTGDCGAMQEQSCVEDSRTHNTYRCLVPGKSYFIQVFTPVTANYYQQVTGNIDLILSAVKHTDVCAPDLNCLAVAKFIPQFDCTTDDAVKFVNYSTYGSSIQYRWDFGYNGMTSTDVSPSFIYPALPTDKQYNVKLSLLNKSCNGKDSVTVPITIPGRPYVDLGKDITACNADTSIALNATSFPGATYTWQDGSSNPQFMAAYMGQNQYYVEVNYNNCISRDTINIFLNNVDKKALQSSIICPNASVQLDAGYYYNASYNWNTGQTGTSINAQVPGNYWVDISNDKCIVRDSFAVSSLNSAKPLGNDTTICFAPGSSYTVDATIAGAGSYQWQDGSSSSTYTITQSGIYWVDVTAGACQFRDSVNIAAGTLPQPLIAGANQLCTSDSVLLDAGAGFTSYLWNDGSTARTLNAKSPGDYSVTVSTAQGCKGASVPFKVTSVLSPQPHITGTTLICNTPSVQLSVTQPFSSYLWSNGATTQSTTVISPGMLSISVKGSNGCVGKDSVLITSGSTPASASVTASVCEGKFFTLASGTMVGNTGVYSDTTKSKAGCDSLVTTVTLTVITPVQVSSSPFICSGTSYRLPSGQDVTIPAVYHDTARNAAGCDSLISVVDLHIVSPVRKDTSVLLCNGQFYTLPSGKIADHTGQYVDTLPSSGGCDSIITNLVLSVAAPVILQQKKASFCLGQVYTLPWGINVSAAGLYADTSRYASGCDSLIKNILLTETVPVKTSVTTAICTGSYYLLPSGDTARAAGNYSDTVRNISGCDSLLTQVVLSLIPIEKHDTAVVICEGDRYWLPSGQYVSAAGVYKDTSRGIEGCNNIITLLSLSLQPKPAYNIQPKAISICEGDSTILSVTGGGIYQWSPPAGLSSVSEDMIFAYPLRTTTYKVIVTNQECRDSLFTTIIINEKPKLKASKSGDINCRDKAVQLTATGGNTYHWFSTDTTLATPYMNSPVVSPATATTYHVEATGQNGCTAEDSIEVKIITGDDGDFTLPSAFTPNGDGMNDCFGIPSRNGITNLMFRIFSREGFLLFSTTNPAVCWDGRYKGQMMPPAAYVFQIRGDTPCGHIDQSGTVVLVK